MPRRLKFHTLFLGVLLILLALIIACGEEATPIAAPTAEPTAAAPTSAATAAVAPTATTATAAPVVSASTPSAAPTPEATPPPAMMEATGTFNFSVPEMGPPNFGLSIQDYQPQKTDNITTGEAMFATDADGIVVPRLVTDWDVDAAGLVYTFHLREGVPWHNNHGEWGEFDADDFVFSLAGRSRPRSASSHCGRLSQHLHLRRVRDGQARLPHRATHTPQAHHRDHLAQPDAVERIPLHAQQETL